MTMIWEARALRTLLLALLVLVPGACASAGGGGGGNPDVLTAEDLSESTANTLLDAIRRERPAWLRIRGGATTASAEPIEVYVDGVRMPERLDALQRLRVQDVLEVRRMSASDATTQFGTGHGSGAIVVRTR